MKQLHCFSRHVFLVLLCPVTHPHTRHRLPFKGSAGYAGLLQRRSDCYSRSLGQSGQVGRVWPLGSNGAAGPAISHLWNLGQHPFPCWKPFLSCGGEGRTICALWNICALNVCEKYRLRSLQSMYRKVKILTTVRIVKMYNYLFHSLLRLVFCIKPFRQQREMKSEMYV